MVKETAYIQLPCHLFLAPLFQERVLKQGFGNQPFVMSPRERCLSKVSENCIFLMVFYEAGRATTNPSCLYLCPRWSHLSVFRPLHWLETQSGLSWCLLQPWLFPALRPLLLYQESSPGKETIIVHCKYQLWNGLIFRPFPWFWLCRRGKHLTCAEASFDNFSNSSLAAASLSSHNSFWDRTCELQWVLQMCRKKKLPTNDKTHTSPLHWGILMGGSNLDVASHMSKVSLLLRVFMLPWQLCSSFWSFPRSLVIWFSCPEPRKHA